MNLFFKYIKKSSYDFRKVLKQYKTNSESVVRTLIVFYKLFQLESSKNNIVLKCTSDCGIGNIIVQGLKTGIFSILTLILFAAIQKLQVSNIQTGNAYEYQLAKTIELGVSICHEILVSPLSEWNYKLIRRPGGLLWHPGCSFGNPQADTRRNNNAIITSKRRRDVVLT